MVNYLKLKMMKNSIKNQIKKLGLVAEDHLLKPRLEELGSYSNDLGYVGGRGFCDYDYVNESIRLVGTKEQIKKLISPMEIIKIFISILITPLIIIIILGITTIAIHETIWNNKKGEADIE